MTFNPVLSWWLLGPLAATALLGLGWILSRTRARPEAAQPEENRAWFFRAALVLLLLLAASRPGLPGGEVQAAATNLNVFFVVDTSSSIAAEDHVPADGGGPRAPRLDGVRADILAVARELGGARYSLITFDSGAAVRMPLTADTSALETAVAVLAPQVTSYWQGSSVTAARTVLAERLASARDTQPERPRLVFYFGDGEQTSAAAPRDMRLDGSLVSGGAVLGYGTRDGGRMRENNGDPARPAQTYIQDPATGTDALSRLDEDRLRGMAQQLAVPYVHRLAGDGPAPMLRNAAPGTLERTGESLTGRTELYWLPAFAAFLLALRETLHVSRELRDLRPARQPATGPSSPLPGEAAPAGSRAARETAGRGPRT